MKFGGTSKSADLERIRRVARLVAAEVATGRQVAVVVSAMAGKTNELVAWTDAAGPAGSGACRYPTTNMTWWWRRANRSPPACWP